MLLAFAVIAGIIGSFLPTLVADFFVTIFVRAKLYTFLVFVSIWLAFVVVDGHYVCLCLSLRIVIAFIVTKPIKSICPTL